MAKVLHLHVSSETTSRNTLLIPGQGKPNRTPFVATLNGHISTENQKQINGFVDEGLGFRPKPPSPYKPPAYDDMVGTRMLKRAHELCAVAPDQRLGIIAGEFPYVSLLQTELKKKSDEIKKEVHGMKAASTTAEGSEAMHYPAITIKGATSVDSKLEH